MRSQWNSQLGFLLAAAGSAVGLGNIWKFPYIVGVNGGGFFVLFYLACITLVALPVMIAEINIGKKAQSNAVSAFSKIEQKPSKWAAAGIAGAVASVLIMSFYSVIGGWILFYLVETLSNFEQFAKPEGVELLFQAVTGHVPTILSYQGLFIALTAAIVICGVNKGIEKMNKIMIPGLLLILFVLLGYVSQMSGFEKALGFLFSSDISKFSWKGALEAVGHSFFTISVGVGIMITYGSYLPAEVKVKKTALTIVLSDTIVALLSGVIIFSVVFSTGAPVGQGPILMFKTLPALFYQIDHGLLIGSLFFLLVTFTALTSAISLLEVPVAYLVDRGLQRKKALGMLLALVCSLGTVCALSFNVLSGLTLWGLNTFDICDFVSSQFLLPVSGLLCVLFYAYRMPKASSAEPQAPRRMRDNLFLFSVRVLSPVAILVIMVVGLIDV